LIGMDRGELVKLRVSIGAEVDMIKGQLDKAKVDSRSSGVQTSPDWCRRARGMLRVKGRQMEQIQTRLSELKLRREKGFTHIFLKHAEQMLPRADFKRILEEVLKECDVSKPVSGKELGKEDLS